jgi:PKD repeat protein
MRKLIPLLLILSALHVQVQAQCDASFSAIVNGATVQVISDTTRPGLLHRWKFGDGTQGFGSATSHTYSAPGVYQVLHTVSDSLGFCNDSAMRTVTISFQASCQASFVATKDSIFPNKYHFFSTSTASGGLIQSHQWTINGNFVSSSQGFSQTLPQGTHLVCLTINTSAGCSSTICDSILVDTATNCNLNAGFIATVKRDTVFLVGKDSTPHLLHLWKLGDGTQRVGRKIIHRYTAPGVYVITHYVRDSASHCVDSAKQSVTINLPSRCQASFGIIRDSVQPKKFYFYSTSTASGGTITAYRWTLNGHVVSTANAFSTILKKGVHSVCLTIKTSAGCISTHCDSVVVDSVSKDSIPFVASFPNPVPGGLLNLQLTLENQAKVKVTVYNARGIVVYTNERNYSAGHNRLNIPVDGLQRGQYFIDIQYGNTRKRSVFQKM